MIISKKTLCVVAASSSIVLALGSAACAGSDGAKGESGAAGATGATGTPGASGTAGATGPAGPEGPPGPQGAPGAPADAGPAKPTSCLDIKNADAAATDGVYDVRLADLDLSVFCNMTDGGWTMIQSLRAGRIPVAGTAIAAGYHLGRYMPDTAVRELAGTSTQIRIVSHDTPANYYESVADAIPIQRLRSRALLQDDATQADNAAYWTANGTLLLTALNYTCPTVSRVGYPNIFWACGNGAGLHILPEEGVMRFENSASNVDIDIFVK